MLTEFYDCDTMMTHWIWFPIANLKSLAKPLGPRPSSFLPETLRDNFLVSLRGSTQFYARQTILKLFQSLKGTQNLYKAIQQEALNLHEIISWAVLESFSESPVTGWLQEFGQAIPIHSKEAEEKVEIASVKNENEATRLISRLLESKIDLLSMNQLTANSKRREKKEELTTNSSLAQIKTVFAKLAKSLESPETQTEAEESKSILNKVVDWCVTNWYELASNVQAEKAKLDLYQEVLKLSDSSADSGEDSAKLVNQSLPLHELLPKKGQDSVATLIVFKRNGTCIMPMSKIQFFSD